MAGALDHAQVCRWRNRVLEHGAKGLERREVADKLTNHRESAPHYQLEPGLETAINMALAVGAPLLVTGDPGTGKTQLAWFLGSYFGIEVRPFLVKSTSTARDLQYEFDAVGYLQAAYAAERSTEHGAEKRHRGDFLEAGPLWRAYEDEAPSVLLIDEIDKAPRDFPNDLLHELDQPPIVVITSNVERRLPGPFLRRCVFHHIELTPKLVNDAVAARLQDFPKLPGDVRQRAIERFWELHGCELRKAPSTAELLVWLAVLNALEVGQEALDASLSELPALGTLVKDKDDLERLRAL